uniref:Macro domain-containing protein n=1 Tax=Periophthalmus magnuspinnatus TaxID=409849 RepID=A0A3B3ZZE6_9GOBI
MIDSLQEQNEPQESAGKSARLSHCTDLNAISPPVQEIDSAQVNERMSNLRWGREAKVMARYFLNEELEVIVCLGDITKQEADALVNAANEDLKHSGGVALALSNAGGPEVHIESSALVESYGKIRTGEAVVTSGGKLKCKKLIHAVGPMSGKGDGSEKVLIQKAITSALGLCEIMEFSSIVLPCISSGMCGVPVELC